MEHQDSLLHALKAYSESDYYPFHMPGHKRQLESEFMEFPNPYSIDITEIEGFDNLHHPETILKESMEHAAAVYKMDKTYYLVNGSTCGILSAICGAVKFGGKILMARNSHKSAYHAVALKHLSPTYVYPSCLEEAGIQGGIDPEEIRQKLEEQPEIEAVFITSPTYEGVVSDVEEIANMVHKIGIPLIVDEAHGAHFFFGKTFDASEELRYFPKSAIECGADIVIQSLHKTLPSLTQTAILHMREQFIFHERIEKYLQIFQTSSPSYLFLASIESCVLYMEKYGQEQMKVFSERMKRWMKKTSSLKHLKILSDSMIGTHHVKDRDHSKIVVSVSGTGLTGTQLARILRETYHLEPEMSCFEYIILMTSFMDREEGMDRLWNALEQIDHELDKNEKADIKRKRSFTWVRQIEKCMEIFEAESSDGEEAALLDCVGRVSRGFLTIYPPGIPALVPGESITEEAVEMIVQNKKLGLTIEGLTDEGKVCVVKGKNDV